MSKNINRRNLVASIGATSIIGTAGCLGIGGDDEEDDESDSNEYEDSSIRFNLPTLAQEVSGGVVIDIESENFNVVPVGEQEEQSGHYHVLVDHSPFDQGDRIPTGEDDIIHLDGGQTDTVIDLDAGRYRLYIQAGDHNNNALDLIDDILITVDNNSSAQIVEPSDGSDVSSPVSFSFSAEEFNIESADVGLNQHGGHFYLLIDRDPVDVGDEFSTSDDDVHVLDDGETSVDVELDDGNHSAVLQVGTASGRATPLQDSISFTVG